MALQEARDTLTRRSGDGSGRKADRTVSRLLRGEAGTRVPEKLPA